MDNYVHKITHHGRQTVAPRFMYCRLLPQIFYGLHQSTRGLKCMFQSLSKERII